VSGRIGVSGVAGFIGSHLAERLVAEGNAVVGVDSFAANYARERKERNLSRLAAEPAFVLLEEDIRAARAARAFRGCDTVVHLAGLPGARCADARRLMRENAFATARLLAALRREGVPRVILASSSSIYGDVKGPAREEQTPRPLSPYARSKLLVEMVARRSPLQTVALRYFTVYGERQRPDMAFAAFLDAAIGGVSAPLTDAGSHVRHFTHIEDAVDATMRVLHGAPAGAVYNVAGPETASVARALRLLEAHLGERVPLQHVPAFEGEASRTEADLGRARRELGWRPRVRLREGLRRQVEHARAECPPRPAVIAAPAARQGAAPPPAPPVTVG
jgi:UDP-glucuronate 4-epimerase